MKIDDFKKGIWNKHPVPLLDIGAAGAWDDLMVDCPFVFLMGPGQYGLFYTGHSLRQTRWGIGLAISSDLIHWDKHKNNPLLGFDTEQKFCDKIDAVSILKRQDQFFLFFESVSGAFCFKQRLITILPPGLRSFLGQVKRNWLSYISSKSSQVVQHAKGRTIGLAISSNLLTWKFFENNPVFNAGSETSWDASGVFSPCLIEKDGRIFMFYGGSDGHKVRTGLAVSDNPYRWNRDSGFVLDTGGSGTWDEDSALIVSILGLEDGYVAFYEGQDKNNEYAFGLAFSKDLRSWLKHEGNPILKKGKKGSFDERIVNSPHGFMDKDRIFLFYGAQDKGGRSRCMAAFFQKE